MKKRILSVLVCCLGIFSANAQTITAPVGQSLSVTNPIDVTVAGGTMNVPSDGAFNIGGAKILQYKNQSLIIGEGAGFSSGTGLRNVFLGKNSGYSNTVGINNMFLGTESGFSNSTGLNNSFVGYYTGYSNTTGSNNMFIGATAGSSNTTGYSNAFFGTSAGYNNTLGYLNYFSGQGSGYLNTTGNRNLFIGVSSGYSNTVGGENSFIGVNAGFGNTIGERNVMIGSASGYYNTSGNDNTYIGSNIVSSANINNATAIGANTSVTTSNTVVLGNASTVVIGASGASAGTTAKLEITGPGTFYTGLKITNLTSASTPGTGGAGKVLSLDAAGNVILVGLTGAGVGTTSVGNPVSDNWEEADGYLYNNSTNGVVIKGTGLDGNSLIVKGGVLSKEVNVKVEGSESWPDYVFKPNYKRMTLGEVEKFISINGHLPNIPSATEMVANGNNLGKTDVKLLEKVEELTLYLLEMKKANDAQAAELKALKQQVNKLRKK